MNGPDRPPLSRLAFEQIELLLDRVDQEHWTVIAGFQVEPSAAAMRPLPLPKTPMALLSAIQTYASVLFKREADQYGQFIGDRNYAPWLGNLETRTIRRVLRTVAAIEEANKPATIAYHQLTDDEVIEGIGKVLFEIRNHYVWSDGVRLAQSLSEMRSQSLSPPPSEDPLLAEKDDPRTWSPLHQRVAALEEIKKLTSQPQVEIPETLIRETIAEQMGIRPEDVTFAQIKFEISGLLPWYPAIRVVSSQAENQEQSRTAQMSDSKPSFAAELKRLLEEAHWKPEDVPDHMRIDCRTVYRHLSGEVTPSQRTVWAYEKAFSAQMKRSVRLPVPPKRQ